MSKVLRDVNNARDHESGDDSKGHQNGSPSIKDDIASQPDTNPDVMDYDQTSTQVPIHSRVEGRESEPPAPRRPGVTTINGGSAGASTPATTSPPPGVPVKADSPAASSVSLAAVPIAQSGAAVPTARIQATPCCG